MAEIGGGKGLPELDRGRLVHVEGVFYEGFLTETGAQVNHPQVEKRVAVTKVTEVDKVALAVGENDIGVLQVTVDGGVGIGNAVDETAEFVFLVCRKERVFGQ